MSTTIDLPNGHTATLRDPADQTVGQRRPMMVLISAFGEARFRELITAGLTDDGERPVTDEEKRRATATQNAVIEAMGLSETDWDLLLRTTNATVYGLLESWTLPQPVPESVADVDDIPGWASDAIAEAAVKLQADHMAANGMTVDAVEVPDSPTGASAVSDGYSAAEAAASTTFPSTPELPSTSTGTATPSVG